MQGLFDGSQVGQAQLGLNHLDVRDRVHLARHVNHVVVFKTAHHIDDGIGLPDVGQKLVAQALPCAGARHQAGNIDKLNNRALNLQGIDDGSQRIQARIGHFDDAHIGLNRAKRVVFSRDARLGQGVKQSRFTDIGQAHDATFHENYLKNQVVECMRSPRVLEQAGFHPNSYNSLYESTP